MTLDPLLQQKVRRGGERATERQREMEESELEKVSWHANKQIYQRDAVNEEQLKNPSTLVTVEIKLSLGPKDQSKILICKYIQYLQLQAFLFRTREMERNIEKCFSQDIILEMFLSLGAFRASLPLSLSWAWQPVHDTIPLWGMPG